MRHDEPMPSFSRVFVWVFGLVIVEAWILWILW